MSYERDGSLPLPGLREIHIGADASVVETETPPADAAGESSVRQPLQVESSSTRAGGTDMHPTAAPLREIHIERKCDTRKDADPHDRSSLGADVKKRSTFISIATWTVVAFFAFWICCQILPLVSQVFRYSFDDWRFYVTGGLLLIPLALLLFVSYRVFRLFRKLPSFSQVVVESGKKEKSNEIKEKLLRGYIDKLPDSDRYAATAGFEDEQKSAVIEVLDSLRGKSRDSRYSDEVGWLADFKRFQALQRARANRIIGHYSKLIGLKTAASPWKIVDVFCVFLNSTLMVSDLAELYNRRVDKGSAFRLVFRWFFNIYISGELGQISAKAADAIGAQLKEPVKDSLSDQGWLDSDWAGTVAQSMPFLAKFAGKIVEGGVNAFFAIRMGRKAVAAFEPLVSE